MPAKRTRTSSSSVAKAAPASAKRSKRGQPAGLPHAESSKRDQAAAVAGPGSSSGGVRGIYDSTGQTLLVALPDEREVEVKLFGHSLLARVVNSGAAVEVSCVTVTSDRDARCEATVARREHEAAQRREDVALLKVDVDAKVAEMQDQYEDMGSLAQEMTDFVALQGQHKRRIKELECADGVQVKYETTTRRETGVLLLGQLARLPRLGRVGSEVSTAVVFLAGRLGVVATRVEEHVTREVVDLAAWRAMVPTGVFVRSFGSHGAGDGQFDCPGGLAVAGEEVFVADCWNHRISVHGLDGTFLRAFGARGSGNGQFCFPYDVAISGDTVFVADHGNNRICVHALDGTFVRSFGSHGSGNGQFAFPCGVSVADGRLYVADSHNHRISVHDLDGTFVLAFGSEGSGDGQFSYPWGVARARDQLFVADAGNNRVSVHALDGTYLRCFGSGRAVDGQFKPRGIAVVGDTLFVTDYGNDCVAVHGLDGSFQHAFGSRGSGDGEFNRPSGLAISNGLVYVSDMGNHRVVVLE